MVLKLDMFEVFADGQCSYKYVEMNVLVSRKVQV